MFRFQCPHCAAPLSASKVPTKPVACPKCGKPVAVATPAVPVLPSPPPAQIVPPVPQTVIVPMPVQAPAPIAPLAVFCPKCNNEIAADVKVCKYCHAVLDPSVLPAPAVYQPPVIDARPARRRRDEWDDDDYDDRPRRRERERPIVVNVSNQATAVAGVKQVSTLGGCALLILFAVLCAGFLGTRNPTPAPQPQRPAGQVGK